MDTEKVVKILSLQHDGINKEEFIEYMKSTSVAINICFTDFILVVTSCLIKHVENNISEIIIKYLLIHSIDKCHVSAELSVAILLTEENYNEKTNRLIDTILNGIYSIYYNKHWKETTDSLLDTIEKIKTEFDCSVMYMDLSRSSTCKHVIYDG